MITHTKDVKEFREGGSLMYECTMAFLSPKTAHLYNNKRIIMADGQSFIRINHATKYKKNGDIEWRLIYNKKGEVIGTDKGISVN